MNDPFDPAAERRFALAAFALMIPGFDDPESGARVRFLSGPADEPRVRLELAQLAMLLGTSFVHLELTPDREAQGPADILVFGTEGGQPARGERCAIWTPATGETLLVVTDGSTAFRIDGPALVACEAPRHGLCRGFTRARKRLNDLVR